MGETQSGREYSKRNGAAVPEAERLSGARGILKMKRETRSGFRKVDIPGPVSLRRNSQQIAEVHKSSFPIPLR